MAKKRDAGSVEWSRLVLERLGCPDVRAGEGSDEWKRSKGSYILTPDLVAGPLVGDGHPSDFYIDVFEPTGDQFVKPLAGSPSAALTTITAVAGHGTITLDGSGDTHQQLYKTMNGKLKKYAGSRANTPMLGLAMFFRMMGNQYVGPVLAGLQAPISLDKAFGITEELGRGTMDRVTNGLIGPGVFSIVLSLPIEQPLSFVLYTAERKDGPRVVLLVNHAVTKSTHPHAGHPVIRWLRRMATTDPVTPTPGQSL